MRVLIACEFSGIVRDAFFALGHEAWSCDLLPTERYSMPVYASDLPICGCCEDVWYPSHNKHYWECPRIGPDDEELALGPNGSVARHIQGDVLEILNDRWDLMIAHPPCTDLCVSGAKHFAAKIADGRQQASVDFFMRLVEAPIPRIAVENPIGIMSTRYRKPDQIVHPFWFGEEARKPTCLWLKNLPLLEPTDMVGEGEMHTTKGGNRLPKWYNLPPGPERSKIRSRTFQGMADAMASQWGNL